MNPNKVAYPTDLVKLGTKGFFRRGITVYKHMGEFITELRATFDTETVAACCIVRFYIRAAKAKASV